MGRGGVGGEGVWVRVTLGHLALWCARAMSCSRLEAHRLHLLLGFSS